MFRDGNNQAMQLVMQGYSDSIRAKTSNQGLAMANAFNQGLSNAVQTHDNHEQAMQNREMTRLQNEYMNRTMDDRVRHQAQQTKANDLANEYTERTLDDRVAHQEQQTIANGLANESQWLNNNHQAQVNKEQLLTSKGRVKATDSQNYANAAAADKEKTITELEHAAYQGIAQPLQDEKGNYYLARYDKETGKPYREYIHEDDAKRRIETNAQMAATRKATTQGETSMQQARTAGLQAQTAQNVNNMNIQNQQKAQFDEAKTAIQASGDTYDEIFYKLGEAARNNESQITLRNGTKMSVEMASMLGNGMLRGNGGGIGGGSSNINLQGGRLSDTQYATKMMTILKDPNATEEQKREAQAYINAKKGTLVEGIRHKVSSISHMTKALDQLTSVDRVDKGLGLLTQYFGGDFAQMFGNLQATEKDALITLATNSMKGALSNKDMDIANTLIPKMWKSNAHGMGVALQSVNKMIEEIEGYSDTYGAGVFTDEHQAKIKGLYLLRDKLSGK